MKTPIHMEIPADDIDRARKFYNKLFGWKHDRLSKEEDYWMVDIAGDMKKNPDVTGGIVKRQDTSQFITNYVRVSDVKKYCKKVERLGGKVLVKPKEVVSGTYALCKDTENNIFALWKSKK